MNEIIGVVLAGGQAKRFWPIQKDKAFFPFSGKPLVSNVFDQLPSEITSLVIVANPANVSQFTHLLTKVPKKVIEQKNAGSMSDALLLTEPYISGKRIIIFIADDVFDPRLTGDVIRKASESEAFGVIPGWKTEAYFPGGYLLLDGQRVKDIIEKPHPSALPSPYVAISGHFIKNASLLLEQIKKEKSGSDDIYEKALARLMKSERFAFVRYEGAFSSLKYPWHVLSVMDFYLQNIEEKMEKNVEIKPYVVIEGPVYISENVKIMEHTKIVGPCYIGKNTIIGNNNIIRSCIIGEGCVTGFNTDITRSYVGNNCWFHSNYIGDSVLEDHVTLGSGAVLANLRLDEGDISSLVSDKKISTGRNKLGAIIGTDVHIGVNASIMPGVKIGKHSFVGSGVTVFQDIPENSFCMKKEDIEVVSNAKRVNINSRETFLKKL